MAILAAHAGGMTLTEMAAAAGLTRAGARRLLLTLVAAGYAPGRPPLSLTPRLLGLARNGSTARRYGRSPSRNAEVVAGGWKESCSAAVLSGEDVVYVARVPGQRIMSVALHVGTRLPAWCTSMGRVLLSGLGDDRTRGIPRPSRDRRLTEKTRHGPARNCTDDPRKAPARVLPSSTRNWRSACVRSPCPIRDRAGDRRRDQRLDAVGRFTSQR